MGRNRLGADSDVEKLARLARKAGFDVEITGGNHIRWTAPAKDDQQGRSFFISALTPRNKYGIIKIKQFLIDHGVDGVRI